MKWVLGVLLLLAALWIWAAQTGWFSGPPSSAELAYRLAIAPAFAPDQWIEIRSLGEKAWISRFRTGMDGSVREEGRQALSAATWKNIQFLAGEADLERLPGEDPYWPVLDGYVIELTSFLDGQKLTHTRQMAFQNYKYLRSEDSDPFRPQAADPFSSGTPLPKRVMKSAWFLSWFTSSP